MNKEMKWLQLFALGTLVCVFIGLALYCVGIFDENTSIWEAVGFYVFFRLALFTQHHEHKLLEKL